MSTLRSSTPIRGNTTGQPHQTQSPFHQPQSPFGGGGSSPYQTPNTLGHGRTSPSGSGSIGGVGRLRPGRNVHTTGAGTSPASARAANDSTQSPPPILPLPDSAMSCHATLSMHLDDYIAIVEQLFESFEPIAASHAAYPHASPAQPMAAESPSATAAKAATNSTEAIMERLIRKDQLFQEAVQKLLAHQALHRSIQKKWEEVARLDEQLVDFCTKLGSLEQSLLDCSSPDPTLVRGLGGKPNPSQRVRARDVTIFAERLSRMSFAPADHLERKAVLHESVTRPPAPLEKLMAGSILHLNEEELTQLLDAEEKKKREDEEAKKSGVETMTDVDHMPGSLAALGRQDSLQSNQTASTTGLPSFAELAQGGGPTNTTTTATVPPTPPMWRQESLHRAMPTMAPVALDLDLESSDSEEDEED